MGLPTTAAADKGLVVVAAAKGAAARETKAEGAAPEVAFATLAAVLEGAEGTTEAEATLLVATGAIVAVEVVEVGVNFADASTGFDAGTAAGDTADIGVDLGAATTGPLS